MTKRTNAILKAACLFIFILYSNSIFSQIGKNGNRFVSASITVNDYTPLTADATAGSNSISVGNSALNAVLPTSLSPGDLIFIIQMQGASMITTDDTTYGSLASYNNSGNYEFTEVLSVPSSTQILTACPLKNNYSAAGRVQVLRVPRYNMLTINAAGVISGPAWNGSTGGVIVIESKGTLTINGTIDANLKGFRPGTNFNSTNTGYGVLNYRWNSIDYGAEKGEGIAGNPGDYDSQGGRYCKGAPLNGGGGGNAHNGGGGGGANCGSIPWTGRGNPDVSNGSWASAWNLEYSGFASSTSSGGGKGGYTFSGSNENALSAGPGNLAWGGDARRESGGRGGHPLDYSTGRIFMGGGGGAGDQNSSYGGAGGTGGGIVYLLCYGNVNGTGVINSNGANGGSTTGNGLDGAGGGGAGGTVIVDAAGFTVGFTVNANGGRGGNQTVGGFVNEAEGPGGGGGGGYIGMTANAITKNANGGANGVTNSNALTEFPPNGATKGGTGLPNATHNSFHILTSTVNVCPGTSANLSFTTIGNVGPGTVFEWYDQPVGGTLLATGTNYTTPVLSSGSYTYYVSSCPGTGRFALQVEVSAVSATAGATTVCAGDATAFTGNGSSSTGAINSWSWNFGNGVGTSASQNPSYTYPSSGTYTAVLTVTDASGCTATASQSVVVSPAPAVNFTAPSTIGCAPLTAVFTNSTSNANSYSWNFGDGSPLSSVVNPSHTYTSTGTYTVILTATNGSCTATFTQNNYVTVRPTPRASFTSNSPVCVGDPVIFTNSSTPNGSTITGYNWNFGDGSPAVTTSNTSHIYSATGTYNVVLTANGNCSDDTTITITVSAGPVANFSAPVVSGCAPLTVNCANTTSGASTYIWNFGDGSPVSNATSPPHVYSVPGNYTISLIATQGSCRDTLIRTAYISVGTPPVASLSAINPTVCRGDSIGFQNSSTGTITSYTWNFGDGTTITTAGGNISHLYANSGTYTVQLSVNANGCVDDTSISVSVTPAPIAAFTPSQTTGCGALSINFTNTTSGVASSYSWNFGDGSPLNSTNSPTHIYGSPGTYTVTLIAAQGSCSDTLVRTNYISVYPQPLSSFSTSSVCLGDTVQFSNLSSSNGGVITGYNWDYDDGSFSSQNSSPHFYSSAGTYSVSLTVSTANCQDDTTINVSVSPAPVAAFSPSGTTVCGNDFVTFTNTTTGSPVYTWNFGDGSPSSSQLNPSHQYSTPGVYSVSLIATQGSCADTIIQNNLITVNPDPQAVFSASSGCLYDSVNVTNSSFINGGTINSYSWDFGDGFTSTATDPFHLYSVPGTYNITLTVNAANCTDDTTVSVIVDNYPAVNFTSTTIRACDSVTVQFNNTTTGASTFEWDFGDGSNSGDFSPVHFYSTPGTYNVLLTAIASSGCSISKYAGAMVIINPTPVPIFSVSRTALCPGECVSFTDLTTGNNNSWSWQIQGGNPSSSIAQNIPSVCFNNLGTYDVTLTVSNGSCTSSTMQSDLINVVNCSAKPEADFISSDTTLCGGSCIDFVSLSLNSVSWQWLFPGASPSTSIVESPQNICYPNPGVYPVTLIAANPNGSDTLSVTSFINVTASPAAPIFTQNGNVLTASSAISYQWFYNNIPISGALNQQYSATLSGPYSVQITDAGGCISTSTTAHVSLVGIEDISESGFVIYPNPANDELFIQTELSLTDIQVEIFDITGRRVIQFESLQNNGNSIWKIDLSTIASGTYLVKLQHDSRWWQALILKN